MPSASANTKEDVLVAPLEEKVSLYNELKRGRITFARCASHRTLRLSWRRFDSLRTESVPVASESLQDVLDPLLFCDSTGVATIKLANVVILKNFLYATRSKGRSSGRAGGLLFV